MAIHYKQNQQYLWLQIRSKILTKLPLFFTFISNIKVPRNPSAINDSGACYSFVGKVALDHNMQVIGLNELRVRFICQQQNQFSPSDEPQKTIWAIRVFYVCHSSEFTK